MLGIVSPVRRVGVVDSHTEGEPTRVVLEGGPELGSGDLAARVELLRRQFDDFRSGLIQEPRGSDAIVGALLCEPVDPASAAGVIFFNDVGYLGMCGHGTIGVVHTLAYLGRIGTGKHTIETPVGVVAAELHPDGSVSVRNVPSYRYRAGVHVQVPGMLPRVDFSGEPGGDLGGDNSAVASSVSEHAAAEPGAGGLNLGDHFFPAARLAPPAHFDLVGDIAWGGNWFFIVRHHPFALAVSNRVELLRVTKAIRRALAEQGITGRDGAVIDHIELCGPPRDPANSSRNFVLCPGATFDRSPCGTGTSAKMACLYADGELAAGELWRQEGILGTHFTGSVQPDGECVLPSITGRAWITADATLIFDATDPFAAGIDL